MHIKPCRNRALAFVPALILFVLILAIVGTGIALLARVASRAVHGNPGDGGGPTTNTPPGSTFGSFTDFSELPITAEQLQALLATSSNTNAEFEVLVMRSTNLIHWELLCRTNTVNHQVLWDDPNPPYPNGFYKPMIVIP